MLTALSIHASEGKLGLCKQERIGIIMHHVESIRDVWIPWMST